MKKTHLSLLLCFLLTLLVIGGSLWAIRLHRSSEPRDIVVLFDNDVHCAISGYETMAALRDSMLTLTPNVTVISMGDFAQGGLAGTLSEGMYVVSIMNSVPYDIATIGNHEFDYTMTGLSRIRHALTAQMVCCNFGLLGGPDLFPPFAIRSYQGRRVAFIGVATPTTYNTSTPTYFQDSLGHILYDFHVADTYARVQAAADSARSLGADYVVVMSHLGDELACAYSTALIRRTPGIDVVLDGHSHHTFDTLLLNDHGDTVRFASTGTKFAHIGMLRIPVAGPIDVRLLPTATLADLHNARTRAVTDSIQALIDRTASEVIGIADSTLSDSRNGQRAVRDQQAAIGSLLCDAFRTAADAQIGIMNSGGIRASLPSGPVTLGDIISIIPFNNRIWRVRATGQQLLDALEVGVRDWPAENGDYPQLMGCRFTIDPAGKSSVVLDSNGMFVSIGATRRIKRVEVEKNGVWTRIDPNATYTIGGQSYILRSGGSSGAYAAFTPEAGPLMTDVEAVVSFIRSSCAAPHHVLPPPPASSALPDRQ